MDSIEPIPVYETRLAVHRIDEHIRSILAETWPLLAPHLERTIDEVLAAITKLPDSHRGGQNKRDDQKA